MYAQQDFKIIIYSLWWVQVWFGLSVTTDYRSFLATEMYSGVYRFCSKRMYLEQKMYGTVPVRNYWTFSNGRISTAG